MPVIVLGAQEVGRVWRVIGVQVNIVGRVVRDHKTRVIDDVVREPLATTKSVK